MYSDSRLFYTRLSDVPSFEASPKGLVPPNIIDAPARLQILGDIEQTFDIVGPCQSQGVLFITPDEEATPGPPSLTRFSPVMDVEGEVSVETAGIELLLPYLDIPLLSSEVEPSLAPISLSEHQFKASKALFDRPALLLADDPGTGRKAAICVALANLVQQGEIGRALILCPEWAGRQWLGALNRWAPSLASVFIRGERECREVGWHNRAHVYLTDYQTFVEDVENKLLTIGELTFQLLVLDGINSIRYQTRQITTTLKLVQADKHWALAGSLPRAPEGWLNIFSLLTPERIDDAVGLSLPDIEKRFFPFMLRRSKADLVEELPHLTRHEVWLDLDPRESQAYQEALVEERDRLSKLGGSVTRSHVMAAISRLKETCNFALDWMDGVKLRALVDLVEDLSRSGLRIIVFSQYVEAGLDRLRLALEAYGVLSLTKKTSESERDKILEAFRTETQWHVLLIETGAITDSKPLPETTYIVHFDHNWNPAVRRRVELSLHPSFEQRMPLTIYEYWVADTIDEEIYTLLTERSLLPHLIPDDSQPADIEDKLALEDWLEQVLAVPPPPEPVSGLTLPISPQEQPPSEESIEEGVLSRPDEVEGEEDLTPEAPPPTVEPTEGDILPLPTEVEGEDLVAVEDEPTDRREEDIHPRAAEIEEEDITPEGRPPTFEPTADVQPLPDEIEDEDVAVAEVQPPSLEPVEGDILLIPTDIEEEDARAAEDKVFEEEVAEQDVLTTPTEPEDEEIVPPEELPPPVEPTEIDLSMLPLATLIKGVELLMQDQGYTKLDEIEELEAGDGEWIAQQARDDETECAYVRFFRAERNLDIRKVRAILKTLEAHVECQHAYLVTTSGYSRACKKSARESEGVLVLITGDELSEYVHYEDSDGEGSLAEIEE